jgi:hypothetical protein
MGVIMLGGNGGEASERDMVWWPAGFERRNWSERDRARARRRECLAMSIEGGGDGAYLADWQVFVSLRNYLGMYTIV